MRLRIFVMSAIVLGCVSDDTLPPQKDGGSDAAAEAGPTGFCATHTSSTTMICADFDTSLDAGWTGTNVSEAGASLVLDPSDPVSPPNALLAGITASQNPIGAMLQLDPVGAGTFAGILRLKVKAPPCFKAGDVITIADLEFFASNVPAYDVQIQLAFNGTVFVYAANYAESGVNTQQYGANQLLTLGAWADIELDLTTAGTPHANLVQQGQVVLSTDLLPGTAPGIPRFSLGAAAPKLVATSCNIDFDNVTLDRQ